MFLLLQISVYRFLKTGFQNRFFFYKFAASSECSWRSAREGENIKEKSRLTAADFLSIAVRETTSDRPIYIVPDLYLSLVLCMYLVMYYPYHALHNTLRKLRSLEFHRKQE